MRKDFLFGNQIQHFFHHNFEYLIVVWKVFRLLLLLLHSNEPISAKYVYFVTFLFYNILRNIFFTGKGRSFENHFFFLPYTRCTFTASSIMIIIIVVYILWKLPEFFVFGGICYYDVIRIEREKGKNLCHPATTTKSLKAQFSLYQMITTSCDTFFWDNTT